MSGVFRIIYGTVFIFVLFSCAQQPSKSDKATRSDRRSEYHVYLLMGQSNMAGRGTLTERYQEISHERVLMLDKENKWVRARHPLHFDKPQTAGVGPGLSFGLLMAKAYPRDTIGLVPCAVGGTTISKWEPGAYDEKTKTFPYDDALKRMKEAKKHGVIKGVIWLQGEGDSHPARAEQYLERIALLVERLRKETGEPRLPFVAGELGRYRNRYLLLNEKLALLPQEVPFTITVSSKGLTDMGDTTHFDSPSASEYGERFARGMLQLQRKKVQW